MWEAGLGYGAVLAFPRAYCPVCFKEKVEKLHNPSRLWDIVRLRIIIHVPAPPFCSWDPYYYSSCPYYSSHYSSSPSSAAAAAVRGCTVDDFGVGLLPASRTDSTFDSSINHHFLCLFERNFQLNKHYHTLIFS